MRKVWYVWCKGEFHDRVCGSTVGTCLHAHDAGSQATRQRAAVVANKTLTEFLLDAGLNAALETLADRRVFQLDEKRWDSFTAPLAAPPNNPKLRKLLTRKVPGKSDVGTTDRDHRLFSSAA
jgi:uncharacterized protein (DUF1778 family)